MKTKKKVSEMEDMKEGLAKNNEVMQQLVNTDKSAEETTTPEETSQTVAENEPKLKVSRKRNAQDTCIAKNVSNGEQVVEILETFEGYEPIKEYLLPAALTAKNELANQFIDTVTDHKQLKTDDINIRQDVYVDIKELARRSRNALIACGASKKVIKDASHYVDLMTGKRIIKRKEGDTRKKISAIHTTHSQQVQNLNGLIKVLKAEPLYAPPQEDITPDGLIAKRNAMKSSNSGAYTSQAGYSTSLVERNEFFNKDITGYVDTFQAVKATVKSIYGSSSVQYKQISGFRFNKIR